MPAVSSSSFDEDLAPFAAALTTLVDFLKTHQNAPLTFPPSPAEIRSRLPLAPPRRGEGMPGVQHALDAYLRDAHPTQSPRFMNQLFSGVSLPGAIGELLSALTNTSMYTYEVAPAATLIERSLLAHMGKKVGFEDGEGIFVSGGTNANHVAMLMARERTRSQSTSSNQKRPSRGMRESKPLAAFCSKDAHYSFETSAHIMGFEADQLIKVETSDDGCMCPVALGNAIEQARADGFDPFFVAATAGTTVRGVFDPISAIGDVLHNDEVKQEASSPIWFHIDGAWGGAASLSAAHRQKLAGSSCADSFTWDAHKLMGMPLICSVILVREKGLLETTQGATTHGYLFHGTDDDAEADSATDVNVKQAESNDGSHLNMGKISLACGRRTSSLKLWLAWQALGDDGFEERVDGLFKLQEHARRRVQQSSVLHETCAGDWMNLCFHIGDDEASLEERDARVVAARKTLGDEGLALVNYATVKGRSVLRMVFSNATLSIAQVDILFDRLEVLGKTL